MLIGRTSGGRRASSSARWTSSARSRRTSSTDFDFAGPATVSRPKYPPSRPKDNFSSDHRPPALTSQNARPHVLPLNVERWTLAVGRSSLPLAFVLPLNVERWTLAVGRSPFLAVAVAVKSAIRNPWSPWRTARFVIPSAVEGSRRVDRAFVIRCSIENRKSAIENVFTLPISSVIFPGASLGFVPRGCLVAVECVEPRGFSLRRQRAYYADPYKTARETHDRSASP